VCCLAGESSTTSNATIQTLKNYAIQFNYWIDHAHENSQLVEDVLSHFPGCRWPDAFLNFVETLRNTEPHSSFLKIRRATQCGPEERKLLFLGDKVKSEYNSARREINQHFSIHWIDPEILPSGANKSSLLLSIRKKYWPIRAWELAKNAIQQKYKRTNPGERFDFVASEEIIQTKMAEYPFNPYYYAPTWLVFVIFGLPAGPRCIDAFRPAGMIAVTPHPSVIAYRHIQGGGGGEMPLKKRPKRDDSQYPASVGSFYVSAGNKHDHSYAETLPLAQSRQDLRKRALDALNGAISASTMLHKESGQLQERLLALYLEELEEAEAALSYTSGVMEPPKAPVEISATSTAELI
jgi:hypothetical protein